MTATGAGAIDDLAVVHDEAEDRYELWKGEQLVGVADYVRRGDVLVVHHTGVDPAHRGHGYATHLVEGMFDDVRSHGLRVDPRCWFVAAHVTTHPEVADLVVDGSSGGL